MPMSYPFCITRGVGPAGLGGCGVGPRSELALARVRGWARRASLCDVPPSRASLEIPWSSQPHSGTMGRMKFDQNFPVLPTTLRPEDAMFIGNLLEDHYTSAVQELLFSHALKSEDVALLKAAGDYFSKYGWHKKAIQFYGRGYELNPRECAVSLGEAHYWLGTEKNKKRNFGRAEELLTEHISEAGAPYVLALLYEDLGRLAEARDLLNSHKRNCVGTVLLAHEREIVQGQEAIELLEEFRDAGAYEVLGELGYLHYKVGDFQQALDVWEDWHRMFEHTHYGTEYGEVLFELGRSDQAKKRWKEYAKHGDKKARKLLKKHFPQSAEKLKSKKK